MSQDDQSWVGANLERATRGTEPEIDRLLENVPMLMAEAERRRLAQTPADEFDAVSALVPLAWRVIPHLATATAILVLASTLLFFRGVEEPQMTQLPSTDLEAIILGSDDAGSTTEWIQQWILGEEEADG